MRSLDPCVRPRCALAVLIAASLSLCPISAPASSYRIVAQTGDVAPDADAEFLRFGSPVINSSGAVAFQSFLSGPTTDVVPHGVFVATIGDSQHVAIAGQLADGGDGARFRTPGPPLILTTAGQTLFYGNLVQESGVTSENDYGIWAGPAPDAKLLARRGDPASGLPPGIDYSLFIAHPTSFGVVGVSASLQGPAVDETNNSAALLGPLSDGSALQLIARSGDLAPGLPSGSRFIGLGAPAVNAEGQQILAATATKGAAPGKYVTGFWGGELGQLNLLVASDFPAPGAPGRQFSDFREPVINRRGEFALQANLLAATAQDQLSDTGIWIGNVANNDLQLVALEGESAPEFSPSAVFQGSAPGEEPYYRPFTLPVLGGSGRIAFSATVSGNAIDFDHNDGVWISDPLPGASGRERTLVAREGEQPPDTPEGTVFLGQDFGEDLIPAFETPLLNTTGQVAFEATTTGPWGAVGHGIWGTDARGELHLIAHTGTQWELFPGDVREISLLKLNAGGSSDDGLLSAINDAGQITFSLNFTDGTEAVIIASLQPGDTDADGDVDLADLNNVRNHFGGAGLGDTNHDGHVDLVDLNNVRNYFGAGASSNAVPEPPAGFLASLYCLIACGALAFTRTRCCLARSTPSIG